MQIQISCARKLYNKGSGQITTSPKTKWRGFLGVIPLLKTPILPQKDSLEFPHFGFPKSPPHRARFWSMAFHGRASRKRIPKTHSATLKTSTSAGSAWCFFKKTHCLKHIQLLYWNIGLSKKKNKLCWSKIRHFWEMRGAVCFSSGCRSAQIWHPWKGDSCRIKAN